MAFIKPGPRDSKPADVSTINEDTAVVRTVDNTDCL